MRRYLAILLLGGLLGAGGSLGCGTNGQATRDDQPAKEKKEKRKPEAPMPENLAESPCGNPKWGQLPEQHEIDGDPKDGEAADSETSPGDEETEEQ